MTPAQSHRAQADRPTIEALLAGDRLPALDGCRALAVATVVISHASIPLLGDLGVALFFVLSGFLITWLLVREHRATGTISLRDFYARRTLRIFPAYYAFLALSIGWDLLRDDSRIRAAILPALFYVMNYYNALHGHPSISIAHAWSLAVEEQFYLLWPLAALALFRSGRWTVPVLGLSIAAVTAWRSVAWFGLELGPAYVYNAFEARADALAVGCLLAVLADRGRLTGIAARLGSSPAAPVLTIAAILCSRLLGSTDYRASVGMTVEALLIALLLLQLMLLAGHPAWRWLESRPLRFIGTISYPIYLYHILGLGAGHRLAGRGLLGLLAGIVLTFGLAVGSYYVIEKPFLRLKRRFATRTTPA